MRYLCYALLFLTGAAAIGAEQGLAVVALVKDIREERPPFPSGVHIHFVVHSPVEYRGLTFIVTEARSPRKRMRADFPLGGLYAMRLPKITVEGLEQAKSEQEHVQRSIDSGVEPEKISTFVRLPRVLITELVSQPLTRDVR